MSESHITGILGGKNRQANSQLLGIVKEEIISL